MSMKSALKTRIGAAFVLLAAAGGAAYALNSKAVRARETAAAKALGVVFTVRDGFRYEFHAPSGRESLFDLRRDPKCLVNVASSNTELLLACRDEIVTSAGVKSLDELRAPYAETIRRLEALGYL
jgi:hypothetical protein